MPKWIKNLLKILAAFILLVCIAYLCLAYYVSKNNKQLLASINKELTNNLNGKMTIANMETSFLSGFPGISLRLNNVIIQDSLWQKHGHTLLNAKEFNISVNPLALLKGTIQIKKIVITNASIYLFTDTNGYTNAAIFKKKTTKKSNNSSFPEIKKFSLNNVKFTVNNKKGYKLFDFEVSKLEGNIDYSFNGWYAKIKLNTLAKSLAFNTRRGSFIKNKALNGIFDINYDENKELIIFKPNNLKIGDDDFNIGAKFYLTKAATKFLININVKDILWKNASALLAPNISSRLNLFDLNKPIAVKCDILGNLDAVGDPKIRVTAQVKNNVLTVPGGKITACNFTGIYTNNANKTQDYNDENSVIKLYQFNGNYFDIPFNIDTALISNFNYPIASGVFKSEFDVEKLNPIIGTGLLKFTNGNALVNLAFKASIEDFKLVKPIVKGLVIIKNTDLNYVPRNLKFKNTAINLTFTATDLLIKNIRLQSGKSVVYMDGTIKNFLNLYYTNPEKILLSWQINSPQLHLGEFLGFLGSRNFNTTNQNNTSNSFSKNLNYAFEKSNVAMYLKVNKVFYNNFAATNATANIFLTQNRIKIKDFSVKHAGGLLKLKGTLTQKNKLNYFAVNSALSKVDIKNFFYAFDNFGLKSLTHNNLNGFLFSKINIAGVLTNKGKLMQNSLNGNIIFDLKYGQLLNFEPIKSVGKFAFPFRDLNTITFNNLNGKFDINGQKITINPMKINSSVINLDVAGVYAINWGTNIAIDVPLRNPKKDEKILDRDSLQQRRMKGIVLHLLATDGENGKIKIKLGKKSDTIPK